MIFLVLRTIEREKCGQLSSYRVMGNGTIESIALVLAAGIPQVHECAELPLPRLSLFA